MKATLIGILAILVLILCVACGDSRAQSSPSPVHTPAATIAGIQTATPTEEPTEGTNAQQIREIYQNLPKPLPVRPEFKVEYQDAPLPRFIVTAVDPPTVEAIQQTAERVFAWFRSLGYEPCQPPLAGAILVTANKFPQSDVPPFPGQGSWEPCSK